MDNLSSPPGYGWRYPDRLVTNESSNPYETATPSISLFRGIRCAILLSFAGLMIPFLSGITFFFVTQRPSPYQNPPGIDWAELTGTYLFSALGCGLVFFLAGIINFTPANKIGFVRALMIPTIFMIIGLYIGNSVSNAYGLNSKSADYLYGELTTMGVGSVVSIVFTVTLTTLMCLKSNASQIRVDPKSG